MSVRSEAPLDRLFRDRQRLGVRPEGAGCAAEHVARELVEQDDQGEAAPRVVREAIEGTPFRALEMVAETGGDLFVEVWIFLPPYL